MATDPETQVIEFARELVNRAIKSSLEQVRGPVAWPPSEGFTTEAGRLAIEQLVAVRIQAPWSLLQPRSSPRAVAGISNCIIKNNNIFVELASWW